MGGEICLRWAVVMGELARTDRDRILSEVATNISKMSPEEVAPVVGATRFVIGSVRRGRLPAAGQG